MKLPKKVLVTGSGGCIGAWVIKSLLEQNVAVIAADITNDHYRLKLLMDKLSTWPLVFEKLDISQKQAVLEVVSKHQPDAIIHLAALQVPFCKQDPSLGASVNVVGTVNIFEAARQNGISKIAYASSVAATAMASDNPEGLNDGWLQTLYGAYKVCNEQTAYVYCQDWQVPSIGIRPSVLYGVSRDQGMSALPTIAILAACLNQPYEILFRGDIGFVYTQNMANAFIQAVSVENNAAKVFDYNGIQCSVEDFILEVQQHIPTANIQISGQALPFPSDMSNQPLIECIGNFPEMTISQGISDTIKRFKTLIRVGKLNHTHIS